MILLEWEFEANPNLGSEQLLAWQTTPRFDEYPRMDTEVIAGKVSMDQPGQLFGLEEVYLEKEFYAQVIQEFGQVDMKSLEKKQESTVQKGSKLYSIQGKEFQQWVEAKQIDQNQLEAFEHN